MANPTDIADTPEMKWHEAYCRFLPISEAWRDDTVDLTPDFIAAAQEARDAFMQVPAPTISALATKMTLADAAHDGHHDLCLADLRMIELQGLLAEWEAAKAEAARRAVPHDEAEGRYLRIKQDKPDSDEMRAAKAEALATEKVYEAALDARDQAWAAIIDWPPPTAAAFGIKVRLICKERQADLIEEGPALGCLLSDVTRLIRYGQFPGWKEASLQDMEA